MNPRTLPLPEGATDEVSTLIETLHQTGRRLEDLTKGEVDTVTNRDARITMLRRAQDQLRHSAAARQTAILNALPANIALLDTEGVIVSVNEAWRRFAGANAIQGPEYGIGLNYLEVCDRARGDGASEAHQAAEGIRSVLGSVVPGFSIEYPCHSPTQQRWFLMMVTPLAGGHPHGVVVMHLEVTAEKQSKEGLRVSELRFRQMAENIRDVFFLVDADSNRMLYISPAYEALWDRSCESLYANPESWTAAIHPDDRASTYRKCRKGTSTGKFEFEFRIVRPDGSIRWIATRGFPVCDDAGRMARIAGVAEDITERKRAERELRESRERLDGIVTSAMDAIVTVDERMCIVLSNPAAGMMFGYTAAELQGQPLDLLIPERFRANHSSYVTAFGKSGVTARSARALRSVSGLRKSGEEFPIESSISKDESTGQRFFTAILRDISERKTAEARIAYLNRLYAVLSGINTLIVHVHDSDALFRGACRIAVEDGGFRMSLIAIVDRSAMKIVPVASAGKDEELLTTIEGVLSSIEGAQNTMVGRAIREKRSVVSNDSQNDPQVVFGKKYADSGVRSMAVLPLIVSDEAMGVLALYAGESEFFQEEEMRLLTKLAGDITFALENIDRQQKFAKLSRISAVSSEISSAIIRAHSKRELLNEACRIAVDYGNFGIAWIGLYDPRAHTVTPAAWGGKDDPEHIRDFVADVRDEHSWGRGELIRAIKEKTPVFSNDLSADPDAGGMRRQEAVRRGYRSQIVLPLMTEGEVAGILSLFTKELDFFAEDEVKVLAEMASDISFALHQLSARRRSRNCHGRVRSRAVSMQCWYGFATGRSCFSNPVELPWKTGNSLLPGSASSIRRRRT